MNYDTILSHFNITQLNDMQKAAMEAIPKQNDVVLISPTGSGKTLAFLLPILQLLHDNQYQIQILIVVPSRELAIQIEQVFKKMGTAFKINACYGGHSVKTEEHNFLQPPTILVGTPGRIAHHLRAKNINAHTIHTLILDEFDKSLEFGFKHEMEFIIQQCVNLKKRILTSATQLEEIPTFVGLQNNLQLNYTKESHQLDAFLTIKSVNVKDDDKLEALMLLLGKINAQSAIVFCNHREAVNRISEQLHFFKIDHGYYHGGLEQIDREKTLIKLRNGSIKLLITTDLAARGLDIPEIDTVIHYQLPTTEDVMIHRNGRTARMKSQGTVYFLLDKNDVLPSFLKDTPEKEILPDKFIIPTPSLWKTLYIGGGKKDKINKMDIVGMLLQKGQLQKEDLGKIEVLDYSAYIAIKADKIVNTLNTIKNQKIKNKKIKMDISS